MFSQQNNKQKQNKRQRCIRQGFLKTGKIQTPGEHQKASGVFVFVRKVDIGVQPSGSRRRSLAPLFRGFESYHPSWKDIGIWCNGSMRAFEALGLGSNPSIPVGEQHSGVAQWWSKRLLTVRLQVRSLPPEYKQMRSQLNGRATAF